MFEKDLNKAFLLDFYGDVLTDHSREILEMYYCDDLSLAEIAENVGISRQGVRHVIKKGEEELLLLEEKLGLARRHLLLKDVAERLEQLSSPLTASEDGEVRALADEAVRCAALILEKNKE